jgi:hypothetical protein
MKNYLSYAGTWSSNPLIPPSEMKNISDLILFETLIPSKYCSIISTSIISPPSNFGNYSSKSIWDDILKEKYGERMLLYKEGIDEREN